MTEHGDAENIGERLRELERCVLGSLDFYEKERRSREGRSVRRAFLTDGLISVQADEEDLRSAGIDTALESTIFDFDPAGSDPYGEPGYERNPGFEWEVEKLWEIKGDGFGGCYGFQWGGPLMRRSAAGAFICPPNKRRR